MAEDEENRKIVEFVVDGEKRRGVMFYYQGFQIWGLTSELLLHFLTESGYSLPFQWNSPGQKTWFQRTLEYKENSQPKL